MSDTGQEPTPEVQAAEGQQTEPEQPKTGHETTTAWTPESAEAEIKALRAEAAKYRNERKAAEKARETAEAAALAEQGKFKELFEKAQPKIAEYDALKERYDALMAQVQETNARRIATIPEAMKSLVPDYDDPTRLAAWLDANSAVFAKPVAPSLDGRAGGNSGAPTVDEVAVKAQAVRLGLDPEIYYKAALANAARR
jgi:hypothetical protein